MEIGRAFAFVVDDREWAVKFLIAAGILFVCILFSWVLLLPLIAAAALFCGYSLEITRRVIRGDAQLLPDWKEWSVLMADGLKVIAIGIVYALPILVVDLLVGVPAVFLQQSDVHVALVVGELLFVLLGLANIAWAIVMAFLLPAAVGLLADRGSLSAAFRFGDVVHLVRNNLSTYLITGLMSWVAAVVGGLGKVACGVGWLVTIPYSAMVTGHLFGQAYVVATKPSA